ncbi:hypothetical protein [Pelagibacterium lentulum]|uniref:Uncharacterized protein n=1 Tax=Pelagibacterium lentulum TaxID=2029865 RepID=A0A916VWY0_9HYPH|nr:hypothetical protein [Pelagibacterium lentulum]GGA48692.1 hypothetical protein GCM10011499_18130 [Pelagibacterium lentulum]
MPIEIHERLSEFSYGYGVTREVEQILRSRGLSTTPFLPSLIHEASLGFDVAFDVPGAPLLLQFKLGQAMRRFSPGPRPSLAQPFWRYRIDTAEPDGQFELLLKAEHDGADVFYVAPKFHDWEAYLRAFEDGRVLRKSLIVRPGEIRQTLDANGVPDGHHKIVYDRQNTYLCSDPLELRRIKPRKLADEVEARIESRTVPIADVLEKVFVGLGDRTPIRRPDRSTQEVDSERLTYAIASDEGRQSALRQERLDRIVKSGRNREQAIALAVGAEAWALGAQLVYVTKPNNG